MVSFEFIQNEYFRSLVIIIVAIAFAKIIHPVLVNYLKKISKKTKTDLDDIMIEILTNPVNVLIYIAGFYAALKSLSYLEFISSIIDKVFFAITLFFLAYTLSKITSIVISKWLKVQKKYQKTPQLINKVVTVIIYIVAFLMILKFYNIEIGPLIATLGIGGLAIGLALQGTLANFFSGLHIISDRPVNVGDFIELDNTIKGFVEDIGWRSTKIRTWSNNIVIIPNSKLAESIIVNDSLIEEPLNVYVDCGVSYESDLDKVEKVTLAVAKEVQKKFGGVEKDFEPIMRYRVFGESNIDFIVILRAEDIKSRGKLQHEFIKALKKTYDKEKIEISWPVRKIVK